MDSLARFKTSLNRCHPIPAAPPHAFPAMTLPPRPLALGPGTQSQQQPLHLLITPIGQLAADGQLRELIQERRRRLGGDGGIWYLTPEDLAQSVQSCSPNQHEAVATLDGMAATWLQLRFGGITRLEVLPQQWLNSHGQSLPPQAPLAPLQTGAGHGR